MKVQQATQLYSRLKCQHTYRTTKANKNMIVKMALIRLKEKWIMYTERNTQEVRDYLHYFKFTISVIFSFHTL